MTQADLREAFGRPPFHVLSIEAAALADRGGQSRHAWLATFERAADIATRS